MKKPLTTNQIEKMLEESILASYEKAMEEQGVTKPVTIKEFEEMSGPLTDAFGFPVTKRTRTRAAQEGYDVVVVRGVAYFVDTQDHIAICE